ncbi:DUF420 domain-containing protein [bacterium]|nr:DUF420 domain-containing protein [bacterium]
MTPDAPSTTNDPTSAPPASRGALSPRRSLAHAFVAPAVALLLTAGAWIDSNRRSAEGRNDFFLGKGAVPLPVIADFSLTERSGRPVSLASLRGRPWIAGFAFTRCGGPCPKLTGEMRKLQDSLAGTDVSLVTFTVDPEFDTPRVLSEYADQFGADKERWLFLTGDERAVKKLVSESFFLPMEKDPNARPSERITHSTKLALVDREGRLLNYFETDDRLEADGLDRLVKRARLLGRTTCMPEVNAALNATSGLLLLVGLALVRRGRVAQHKRTMLTALAVSVAFLACYVTYHAQFGSVHFPGEGGARALYLGILITHVGLAFLLVPLAATTSVLGLKGSFERHARVARLTFPVWLYVSSTGVAVYLLLYRIYSGVP